MIRKKSIKCLFSYFSSLVNRVLTQLMASLIFGAANPLAGFFIVFAGINLSAKNGHEKKNIIKPF